MISSNAFRLQRGVCVGDAETAGGLTASFFGEGNCTLKTLVAARVEIRFNTITDPPCYVQRPCH
jgi:hypothetical protein